MTGGCARKPRWLAAAACCLALAVQGAGPMVHAPNWVLDSCDGVTVDFHADARGQPAVLVFWATWCPHCRATLPLLEAVRKEYAPRGVKFYALNIWEDGDAEAYFEQRHYHMPLFLAADLVAEEYGIEGTPGIVVSDGERRVLPLAVAGVAPGQLAEGLRALLEGALAAADDAGAAKD